MSTDPPIHPYDVLTTPAGKRVNIDTEMLPVIRQLWRLGLTTTACCQDVGEATAALRKLTDPTPGTYGDGFIAFHRGYALLKMPRDDARRLATALLNTPFGDRLKQRWRPKSWRMHVPVIYDDDHVALSAAVLIHFPREQVSDLTETLADMGDDDLS